MYRTAYHDGRGFTLFELLIVMAVVGILVSVAVPSYQYVINANRISAEVNSLLGDMQFARAEAIKEGQTVTVCVSTNLTTCATGTAWNGGWIVFSDVNGTGSFSSGDTLLRVQKPFNGTDTFTTPSNSVVYVSFNREGFATGNSGFIASGTTISLHAATASAGSTRCLAISFVGLMQVLQYNGSTCT